MQAFAAQWQPMHCVKLASRAVRDMSQRRISIVKAKTLPGQANYLRLPGFVMLRDRRSCVPGLFCVK